MNPFARYKRYIIGQALEATDDVFEKARIEVLFNFTNFFLFFGVVFSRFSLGGNAFQFILSASGVVFLVAVLAALRKTGNVLLGAYIYITNHTIQNICHFLYGSGHIEMISVSWLLLYAIFGFLVLGNRWGSGLTLIVLGIIIFAIFNEESGFRYYHYRHYLDSDTQESYTVVMPILLNVYLISQFVSARKKAEKLIKAQKKHVEFSNRLLESKNKDITDSIHYAKKIQYAILPNEEHIYRSVPLSFVLYKPRDIVSGDFFWFYEPDRDNYIIVCADCTGHGVPGAFMTVIGSSLLDQVITENKITSPAEILSELDKRITHTLKQEKERSGMVQDGMDLALLRVNKSKKEFSFTSAKRPAVFIRNRELHEFKGSKFTLGGMHTGEKRFEEIKMSYREDDMIYFFTDGYTDQFGGERGKKFSFKRLKEIFLSVHELPVLEQKDKLEKTIESWRGTQEQVDDICVIGIKF